MGDFWIDFALSIIFTLLRGLVKDPEKKEAMRKAFYKMDGLIHIAYPELGGVNATRTSRPKKGLRMSLPRR